MKVTVFGLGYVGLVQAAVLAEVGHTVMCVDSNEDKLNQLRMGIIPIFEPNLAELVKDNIQAERLLFSVDAQDGVCFGDIIFIAVGTPSDEDGSADLSHVLSVAKTIGTYMNADKIIVNKSTVPVGTADKVTAIIHQTLADRALSHHFVVVSNPEFLKEGSAVSDCMKPDRIIVGTTHQQTIERMRELYAPFNRNHEKLMIMDSKSAELTKYAANCLLATKISFMNELANIAENLGADIESVRQGIGADPRIGHHFIYAGCGYGGSCFPKDVSALIQIARESGLSCDLVSAVKQVNDRQRHKLFAQINHYFNENLSGKVFAIWGISFKPNTDDIREAPSRFLMEALWQNGAMIQAYDPEAMHALQSVYGHRDDLVLMGTKEAALKNADALVICTEWKSFFAPDFDLMMSMLKSPVIFDGRNIYDPARMKAKGFRYFGIGRGYNQGVI